MPVTLDGVPVRVTSDAPATRRNRSGRVVPALCWQRGGEVLVHPTRVEGFKRAFEVEP